MTVQDLMTTGAVTVHQEETVAAAARLLSRNNIGALPVVDLDGRLKGMLTDRDITVRCVAAGFDPNLTRVRTVMSSGTVTTAPDRTAVDAAQTMAKHGVRRLPVTDRGKLVGMLSQGDFAGGAKTDLEAAEAFMEVFTPVAEM